MRHWITISSAIGVLICFLPISTVQARVWEVPGDAPTIQAGIDSATIGDEVIVACGTYFEHDIEMKAGIILSSATGQPDCVTINAQGLGRVMICAGIDTHASITGFTFTGGLAAGSYPDYLGGGIYCEGVVDLEIRSCLVTDNTADYGGGLYCKEASQLTVGACLIYANSSLTMGGGIFCFGGSPTIEWCTISDNRADSGGDGVYCTNNSAARFYKCTIHGNDGDGVMLYNNSGIDLEYCLIAFNPGAACECEVSSVPALECCDLFGNGSDWSGHIAGQEGLETNFSAAPLFCSQDPVLARDWSLSSNSPCLAPQTPCTQIGAWGADCIITDIEPATWGHLKTMYR
ncbi:MAG: right-handed parallel beta-helix repeat-containing protein [bacterium]